MILLILSRPSRQTVQEFNERHADRECVTHISVLNLLAIFTDTGSVREKKKFTAGSETKHLKSSLWETLQ